LVEKLESGVVPRRGIFLLDLESSHSKKYTGPERSFLLHTTRVFWQLSR
jgi:hypothetical protein